LLVVHRLFIPILALAVLASSGCSTPALLSSTEVTDAPWRSFAATKSAYDGIVPGQTSVPELDALGFSPEDSNASTLVTYVEVQRVFVPHEGITLETADAGVRRCVEIRQACTVWKIDIRKQSRRRIGNFVVDWLYFQRVSRITGWSFEALILIEGEQVLYKIWAGSPDLLQYRRRTFPLGFIQRFFEGPPIVNDRPQGRNT
jgi:hypothetical protein